MQRMLGQHRSRLFGALSNIVEPRSFDQSFGEGGPRTTLGKLKLAITRLGRFSWLC
jgi:hypothetical protein